MQKKFVFFFGVSIVAAGGVRQRRERDEETHTMRCPTTCFLLLKRRAAPPPLTVVMLAPKMNCKTRVPPSMIPHLCSVLIFCALCNAISNELFENCKCGILVISSPQPAAWYDMKMQFGFHQLKRWAKCTDCVSLPQIMADRHRHPRARPMPAASPPTRVRRAELDRWTEVGEHPKHMDNLQLDTKIAVSREKLWNEKLPKV